MATAPGLHGGVWAAGNGLLLHGLLAGAVRGQGQRLQAAHPGEPPGDHQAEPTREGAGGRRLGPGRALGGAGQRQDRGER